LDLPTQREVCLVVELVPMPRIRFSDLARECLVCGAQLAIQHHDEVMTYETGDLEYRGERQVTRNSAFPVGSVTKAFSATLAMMSVADGDADLDIPLGGLLSELGALGSQLTLRQLLSHTTGLACAPDSSQISSGSPRRYVADQCVTRNLVLSPGTGFSYSNLGYVVVGRLIEVLTGMTWADALSSLLLKPLGIEPTFLQSAVFGAPPRAVATGHSVTASLGRTVPVRQSMGPAEASAGALAASAMDLVELGRLQLPPGSPWLLPPDHARLMREPVPGADPFGLADGWGLGLALFRGALSGRDGTTWAGHDGNADGTSCHLRVDPAGEWIVALTTNTNTGTGLWRRVCGALIEAGVPLPEPSPTTVAAGPGGSRTLPADCAGAYANGETRYRVSGPGGRTDGQWTLAASGAALGLLPSPGHDLTFALLDRSTGLCLPGGRFRRDPISGRVSGLLVSGRVARRVEAGEF
jgi:CubicO group peptidase (beta-lactamase class C family)